MRISATVLSLLLLFAAAYVYTQPDTLVPESVSLEVADSGLTGEEVAQRYCQSCHVLPRADRLPKETWPFLIQWMGNYLGYERLSPPFDRLVDAKSIPANPLVSKAEMSRLGQHFIDGAMFATEFVIGRSPEPPIERFRPRVIDGPVAEEAIVTLVHADEVRGWLWVGTAHDDRLRAFDSEGNAGIDIPLEGDPIYLEQRPNGVRVALAGDFQKDHLRGRVVDLQIADGRISSSVVLSGLHRTIETHTRDIDGDGIEDILVVAFGDGVGPGFGDVSIYWGAGEASHFARQPLLDRAGGLGAHVIDIDRDGRLDVVVLATQGSNEVIAYLNRGGHDFERTVLVQKGPSFGNNSFHIVDFNGNGQLDIVLVNGNNMELPNPPLRPYHGVRILLGDGALGFEEAYFYPMYGALTAFVRDMDGDGDLDIGLNAFYPSWEQEEPETFTLLENRSDGELEFRATTLRGEGWNRWLRIDTGDLDRDGLPEIYLGAGNVAGGGLEPDRPETFIKYRRLFAAAPTVVALDPVSLSSVPKEK